MAQMMMAGCIGCRLGQEGDFVTDKLVDSMGGAAKSLGVSLNFMASDDFDYNSPGWLINDSDFVLCDLSNQSPNDMMELGIAIGTGKPLILVAESKARIPSSISGIEVLIYDESDNSPFFFRMNELMRRAVEDPESLIPRFHQTDDAKNKVFISYSHADADTLNRLLIHLKPLERQGVIDYWVDTKLRAGDHWEKEILNSLRASKVAILLVSADFLASDFIVNNELPPLLSKAQDDGTRIIPVVLSRCRFARDPNLNKFQAINDPKRPLLEQSTAEKEKVFDEVASLLEDHFSIDSD